MTLELSKNIGSPDIPEVASKNRVSTQTELAAALDELVSRKAMWVDQDVSHRIHWVDLMIQGFSSIIDEWVALSIKAKGIQAGSPCEAEEWLGGPFIVLRNLRFLKKTLNEIRQDGRPLAPTISAVANRQQISIKAMPYEVYDYLFFPGITARVWMDGAVTAENVSQHLAACYRQDPKPRVCLVLGGGNVSSIAPLDVFYKMFVEKQVVVLKMNPVNDYLGPAFEKAFQPLIEAGYLKLVYGGVEVGKWLCAHKAVDEIHVTGSNRTFDAIVWGVGDEGAARKSANTPLSNKTITSELGNVSPVIVVPGQWSQSDLMYQANRLASMLANNAGFNCNATRVIINHQQWSQRPQLLQCLRQVLDKLPTRNAYYPGAAERHAEFVNAHEDAQQLGATSPGDLPWTLIEGVESSDVSDMVFNIEAFCSVFAETTISATDTAEFIDNAVEFVNQHVWGSLNACIIIDPRTARQAPVKQALERAIENLKYGTVSVNFWPALGYALGTTPWGAFPGHTRDDVQSGQGVVHNTMMLDNPQKTVIRGPFKIWPVAPWFVNHPNPLPLARQLTQFQIKPSVFGVFRVLFAALFGRWLT